MINKKTIDRRQQTIIKFLFWLISAALSLFTSLQASPVVMTLFKREQWNSYTAVLLSFSLIFTFSPDSFPQNLFITLSF